MAAKQGKEPAWIVKQGFAATTVQDAAAAKMPASIPQTNAEAFTCPSLYMNTRQSQNQTIS